MEHLIVCLNSEESIVYNLYETLETLRYPEVAQIRFEEFQDKILTSAKRIDLLQWILTESPGFNSVSFNIIKANTPKDKLFKCYSQIGLCNEENVLFGNGPAEKEFQFLFLLTLFIKNLHLADSESLNNDKTIIKLEKENLSINENISDEISKKDEGGIELRNEVKSEECLNSLTNESSNEKYSIDKLCLDIQEINKEYTNRSHTNYEQSLENFNSAFKNVSSLSAESTAANTDSEVYNDISSDMQDIHSTFSTINKNLLNKTKIKSQPILESSTLITESLTSVIKDNLVLVEQACNTFMED